MLVTQKWFTNPTLNGLTFNHDYPCNKACYYQTGGSRDVQYIAIHYTGNTKDNAINNVKYYTWAQVEASAHLFVDDGNIVYQSVPLNDRAWHVGAKKYIHPYARNANSIGIEMACTAGNYTVSEKTKVNAAYLTAYCCQWLGIIADQVDTYVIRHYDVMGKECPRQFVRNPNEWVEFKQWVKNILTYGSVEIPAQKNDEEDDDMTQEKFNEMMNNYLVDLANQPATWETEAIEWAQNNGLLFGDEHGNLMPKKFLTRGEFAQVLMRYDAKKDQN